MKNTDRNLPPQSETEEELGQNVREILNQKNRTETDKTGQRGKKQKPDQHAEPEKTVPDSASHKETREEKKARRRRTAPYVFVSYFFVLIFVMLAGYLVYFNFFLKDTVLSSPYNKRQDAQAEYVIRGNIESADGQVLAKTEVDGSGNETRVYPYANEYAHVVGYASNGKSGLETIANYDLLTSHYDFLDRVINEFEGKKNPGDTVVSTIKSSLQDVCYNSLGDYQGAVIVMNPKTGAIYAMVSKPDFDPNTISDNWKDIVSDKNNSVLVNRATQGLYPPGSIFKIVTALSYFRNHATFSGFSYDCTGEMTVDNYTAHCYAGEAHGQEDFTQAFANSCNCAFAQIGLDLGTEKLTETAGDLLFGKDLPSVLPYNKSRFSLAAGEDSAKLVQTAFGQGDTLVTPYHMALLVSAIANDGVLMQPYLIEQIKSTQGVMVSETKAKKYTTLMTKTEAGQLRLLMEAVVREGTARQLSGQSYTAAGKTGSAEYVKSDGTAGTHSWFVGYSNTENPELVVAVLAEDGGAGSETAVPIAQNIFDAYYAK